MATASLPKATDDALAANITKTSTGVSKNDVATRIADKRMMAGMIGNSAYRSAPVGTAYAASGLNSSGYGQS